MNVVAVFGLLEFQKSSEMQISCATYLGITGMFRGLISAIKKPDGAVIELDDVRHAFKAVSCLNG